MERTDVVLLRKNGSEFIQLNAEECAALFESILLDELLPEETFGKCFCYKGRFFVIKYEEDDIYFELI